MEVNPGGQQQDQLVYAPEKNRKPKRKVQIETVEPSFSTKHTIIVAVVIAAIFISFIIYQITVRGQELQQSIQIDTPDFGENAVSVSQGSSQNTGENLLSLYATTNHKIDVQKDEMGAEAQKKHVFGSDPPKQQQFLIHPANDAQKSSQDRQVLTEVSKQLLKLKNLKQRGKGVIRNQNSSPKATSKQQQQQYKQYLKKVTANQQTNEQGSINWQVNEKEPSKEKQDEGRFPRQKDVSSIKPFQQPKKHMQERMQKEEQPKIEQSIKRQQQRKIQQMKDKLQQKKDKPLRNKQRELKWKEQMAKKKQEQEEKKKKSQIKSQPQKTQSAKKNPFQINKQQQQERKKAVLQLERQRQQTKKRQQQENKKTLQQEGRKKQQQEDRQKPQQLMKRQKLKLQQRRSQQEQRERKQQQQNRKLHEQQQRKKQQAQRQKQKRIQQQRAKEQQLKQLQLQKQRKDPQQAQLQRRKEQFLLKKKQQMQKAKAQQQRKKMDQQTNKNLLPGIILTGLPKPQEALNKEPIPIKQQSLGTKDQHNQKLDNKKQQSPEFQSKQKLQILKENSNRLQQQPQNQERQQKKKQEVNEQSQQIKKLQQGQLRKEKELIAKLMQMEQKRQKIQPQIQKLLHQFDNQNEQNDKKTPKMSTITPSTENRFPIDMIELYGIHQYIIPKFVWTYVDFIERQSVFVRHCIENQRHFARLSLFQLQIVNTSNFKTHLAQQTVLKIEETLNKLYQRMRKQPQSNLKDHFETIRRRLIMFHILNERGGIFVQANVLFTENFDWLRDINTNRYANVGSVNTRAQYVGFSDIDHGTPYEKHNKIGVVHETERYMIEFPSFEPYFLAAVANGEFLTRVLEEYGALLHEPNTLQEKLQKYQVKMGAIFGKDLYYQLFYISQHLALRKKQGQINASGNSKGNKFAIDYYGFFTINQRYFPKKIHFTFQNNLKQKVYRNLAKYTLQQLQQTVGPLSYIVCMPFEDHMNYMIENIKIRNAAEEIHPQSFLSKLVVRNRSQPFIQHRLEVNKINVDGKIWDKLPKIIWIFWDTGFNNAGINYKLCIDNIRRNAQLSQFQVRQLNDSNIQQYLGSDLNARISRFIQNKKIATFPQTKSDFVRIAIIGKYGGIYMDASYFSVQNFDWIINISNYPSKYIFNRYGELPKVLMLFHPHFGQPFQWKFDREANTKNMWLSAYENNLLIAEPNQQIFNDWLEEFGNFITRPYQQSEKTMAQYNILGDRWTYRDNTYLVAMDAVKVAIGKKQKQIRQMMKSKDYKGPKSAAEYYRIWSTSGYRGQQKFRAHTNFDNTYASKPFNSDNVFLWRYSQQYVSGIVGKVNHFVKLYGKNIQYLNEVLERSYDSNFKSQIHPQSFFMKYLFNSSIHRITSRNGKLKLEYLKK